MLAQWPYLNIMTLDFSRPGKLTDNAFIEALNRPLRQECLNAAWLVSMSDARNPIETWRQDYNRNHTHTSLGGLTPEAFAAQVNKVRKLA